MNTQYNIFRDLIETYCRFLLISLKQQHASILCEMTTFFQLNSLFLNFLKKNMVLSNQVASLACCEYQVDNKDYKDNQVQVCNPYLI